MCRDPPGSVQQPCRLFSLWDFMVRDPCRLIDLGTAFDAFRRRDCRLETEIGCQCGRVYVTALGLRSHLRCSKCGTEPSFVCSFPTCEYKTHEKRKCRSLLVHGITILQMKNSNKISPILLVPSWVASLFSSSSPT